MIAVETSGKQLSIAMTGEGVRKMKMKNEILKSNSCKDEKMN